VTSLSAQAEQRWFEVELLMFQRDVDIQNITEHLSSEQIVVDTSNSISLLKASNTGACLEGQTCLSSSNPTVIGGAQFDAQGNHFKRLGSSRLQLTAQRQSLEKHANFNPVLHMAWRMPVARGTSAKPLHIFAGKNLALTIPTATLNTQQGNQQQEIQAGELLATNTVVDNTASTDDTLAAIGATEARDKWEIDGNFKIYLDHYLYIDSQLIIRKAITETIEAPAQTVEIIDDNNDVQIAKFEDTTQTALVDEVKQETIIKEVLFDQSRRLRSEEIHYLDHPLLGIIVQIRKIPAAELAFTAEQLIDPKELLATEPLSEAPLSNGNQSLGTKQQSPQLPVSEESALPEQLPVSELLPAEKTLSSPASA